jgi:hypothetical protein
LTHLLHIADSKTLALKTSSRRVSVRHSAVLGFGLLMAFSAQAADDHEAAAEASNTGAVLALPAVRARSNEELANPESLGGLTDAQLTDLAADWRQLDSSVRADLIAETRERMQPQSKSTDNPRQPQARADSAERSTLPAESGKITQGDSMSAGAASLPQVRKPSTQITVRTQRRRYGRVVRKSDGSLVRIETEVVTVQRRDPKRAFGVGFERRQRQHGQQPESVVSSERPSSSVPADTMPSEVLPSAKHRPMPHVLTVNKALD